MGKPSILAGILLLATSTHLAAIRFHSRLYPYNVRQPAGFRHVVLTDATNHKIDYFFPPLGSFTTNLNVYAGRGSRLPDERAYLRSHAARWVKPAGWVSLAGQHLRLLEAGYHGLAGRWITYQADFVARGLTWHLTVSYDLRFRREQPILLRMLRSFRLGNAS